MQRLHIAALVAVSAAIPIAAGTLIASPKQTPCFSVGGAQFRMTTGATADFRVRVVPDAAAADVRFQFVDTPETADFVLIDDSELLSCAAGAGKSIRVDASDPNPNMVVSASEAPADYKIYVRSAAFSRQQAAALFAVMWREPRKRLAAQP